MTGLTAIRDQHRFDQTRLETYLATTLPEASLPLSLQQFQGGQSNPTYLITDAAGRRYVLRKKPPGDLLPSAHAIEREFAVMRALAATQAAVPNARLLCEDAGIIGTPFYVMDFIEGRVLTDMKLTNLPAADRAPVYFAMADSLACLHRVDWRAAGLQDFGKPDAYIPRQIARWTRQYLASHPHPNDDMERLIAWLPAHVPAREHAVIAHGDFRLGNLMFAPATPDVLAILDWELATIGDPLADLAYLASFYRLPPGEGSHQGLAGIDLAGLGIPSEADLISRYSASAGIDVPARDWPFYLAFSLFRSAAIGWGVFDRSRRGNAADAAAHLYGEMFATCARIGWQIACA